MQTRHGHDSEGEHELRMQRVAAEPEENEEHGLITGAPNLASKALSAPRIRQAASVAGACLIYLTIGPTLIIVNRTLLVARKFNYPMTVASLGVLCSTVVSFVLVHCRCVRREHTNLITPKFFVYNLLPIGASLATTLACGNWVHLYLPVGFIQMLKATTPMVTLAMLWVSGIETPTLRVTLSVLGIVLGTCIASLGASLGGNFSVVGLGLMLLAELSEALKLVLIQKMLTNLKFGVIEGQYYMAPVSALWLCSAAMLMELPKAALPAHRPHALALIHSEPQLFIASAVLGFGVHLGTFLVIKTTNSVTLKVLGTMRNAGLVLFSATWYDETITHLEAIGYCISLLFFAAYNFFKIRGL